MGFKHMEQLPIIDISPLLQHKNRKLVAEQIRNACCDKGFFYIVGHGIDVQLQAKLEALSRQFFAWPEAEKLKSSMDKAGRAWRGFFPVGGELTS